MYISIQPTSKKAEERAQSEIPLLRQHLKAAVDSALEELSEGPADVIVQLEECKVVDADPDGPDYVLKCRTSDDHKLLLKLPRVRMFIEGIWEVSGLGPAELTPLFDIKGWKLIGKKKA